MAENVKTKSRGAKMLLASLSIAATLSGWAWLSVNEPPPPTNPPEEADVIAPSVLAPVLQAGISASIAMPPRSNLPNLADLPVRGLREVGDTEFFPQPQSSQSQAPAVRQRQNNGGAQTQAQPQPKPKPKPVRKAKSSK